LIVTVAADEDRTAVDALREAYFARSEIPIQERSAEAVWIVARDRDRVVHAVACLEDVVPLRQRWLMDCYRGPGRAGKLGLLALYDYIRAGVERDALDLVGMCEPDNEKQIQAYKRRGGIPVGIMLRLPHKELPCRPPSQ
jgi:hypothetical protein